METLVAQTRVDDHMLMVERDKDFIEKYVHDGLSRELAKAIMKDPRFNKIVVKREDNFSMFRGETIFKAEVVMLTCEEAKEYKELQKLKELLKITVR